VECRLEKRTTRIFPHPDRGHLKKSRQEYGVGGWGGGGGLLSGLGRFEMVVRVPFGSWGEKKVKISGGFRAGPETGTPHFRKVLQGEWGKKTSRGVS